MATRSGKRRRRKDNTKLSKEAFEVLGPDGEVLAVAPSEGAALSKAQNVATARALQGPSEDPLRWIVRLKPLFGPPDNLYEVVLTCVGAILTYPAGALRTDRAR